MRNAFQRCRLHPAIWFALLSLLWVFLLYAHAINAPFIYDDIPQIEQNSALQSWHSVAAYFHSAIPFSDQYLGAGGSFYRPFFWVSLALDRMLWGLNPIGFHITNLILHWGDGLLVFLLLRQLHVSLSLGMVTSLVWLALPINSEVVAWISGRTFCLLAFFLLLSLMVADHFLRSSKAWLLLCYFGAAMGALLSHEAGVLVLPLTILIGYAKERNIRQLWFPLCFTAATADILYFVLRHLAGAQLAFRSPMVFSMGRAILKYLSWIVLPVHMSMERSTDMPPDVLSVAAALGIAGVLALVGLLLYLWNKVPEAAAGLSWTVIALFPFSGIVFIYAGMAERYGYIASMGLTLAIVAVLFRSTSQLRPFAICALLTWIVWGAWRLNTRVLDWCNETALYTRSLQTDPNSPVLLYDLGVALSDAGYPQVAAKDYQRAISLNPRYTSAMLNLGNLLRNEGRPSEAIPLYQRAISVDPNSTDAWIDLGDAYLQAGLLRKAQDSFQKAINIRPHQVEAVINLGATFQQMGDLAAAERQYRRAVVLDPTQSAAFCDLGALYLQQGDQASALEQFNRAIRANPSYAPAYFDLGVVYQQLGIRQLAAQMFLKALQIKPEYKEALSHLVQLQRNHP